MLLTIPLICMLLGSPPAPAKVSKPSAAIQALKSASPKQDLKQLAAKRKEQLIRQRGQRLASYQRTSASGSSQDGYSSHGFLDNIGTVPSGYSDSMMIYDGGLSTCQ